MSEATPASLFAKGSIELQLAKFAISLGVITLIGIAIGFVSRAFGLSNTVSTTSMGVAILASVLNLYTIVTLVAILYSKEKENHAR